MAYLGLPVYAKTLNIGLAEKHPVSPDAPPILTMPYSNKVMGRPGFLHGGAISALLEMAAIVAVHDALIKQGEDYNIRQANVTIDFMRGGVEHDTFGQGEVTRIGRTLANVSASLWQDDPGRIIAKAHMHYLIG